MYNFVVFISDLNLIKKMGSIIFNNFNEMNLVGIVSNHKELDSICKKEHINLIVISEDKYNSKPIQKIIEKIDSTIVLCTSDISNKKNKDNLFFLSVNDSDEDIIKKLHKFNEYIYEQFIRTKVIHILKNLKFDFKVLGTTYFVEAIVYSYITKDSYKFENLEKYIYPWVSQKYNVDLNNIKWAIIRSVNSVKKRLTPEDFIKNNMSYPEKITSKFLIIEIINHL